MTQLTVDDLLEAMRKHDDWRLDPPQIFPHPSPIRTGRGQCPINWLADSTANRYQAAAARLGFSIEDANAIADAVDGWPGYDAHLRARLLEAAGLADCD